MTDSFVLGDYTLAIIASTPGCYSVSVTGQFKSGGSDIVLEGLNGVSGEAFDSVEKARACLALMCEDFSFPDFRKAVFDSVGYEGEWCYMKGQFKGDEVCMQYNNTLTRIAKENRKKSRHASALVGDKTPGRFGSRLWG